MSRINGSTTSGSAGEGVSRRLVSDTGLPFSPSTTSLMLVPPMSTASVVMTALPCAFGSSR